MTIRQIARLAFSLLLGGGTLSTAVSCGSSNPDGKGGMDASVPGKLQLNGEAGLTGACKAETCASMGYDCGDNADGCGRLVHCGSCAAPAYCGGGGFSKCGKLTKGADGGPIQPCLPKTCGDYPADTCGQQSDGCGGLTTTCAMTGDGGLCSAGQYCGGGGSSLCGTGMTDAGDAGPACMPKTCGDYPVGRCGQQSDGCGGLTVDCTPCVNPQFCGGGGTPGVCGGNDGLGADGGQTWQPCVPKTCADLPSGSCGVQGDGCGGQFGPCATCTLPAYCGGGGASLCGGDAGAWTGADAGTCTPKTCSDFPSGTCGQQTDGCGGLTVNCATCTNPQFCGGGGPYLCGGSDGRNPDGSLLSTCVPATCTSKGYNCGQAGDGCGGVMGPCGSGCSAPQVCGGGGQPNVCGSSISCTGLCAQRAACDAGTTTSLSGTVVAGTISTYLPAGVANGDPVPNVLVYIPNSTVKAFLPRASETQAQQCSTCGADVSGDPLVESKTAYNGTFTLQNVPVGSSIPVVIQLGRWRRQFTVSVTNSCGANTVNASGMPAGILRMPRTQLEGDIPLTAISTGNVDAMECVLLKMGVDTSEFTINTTTSPKNGRVHMYQGNGAVSTLGGTPSETALLSSGGTYNDYDQVILPCWGVDPTYSGSANIKTTTELQNLVTYGNNGGHFFATHYSYAWLYDSSSLTGYTTPYSLTAKWHVDANPFLTSISGVVSQTAPPAVPVTNPGVFVQWLNYTHSLSNFTTIPPPPNPANVTISIPRHDVDSVLLQSVDWIDTTDPGPDGGPSGGPMLLHYTFDTPVVAPDGGVPSGQCGHAIFSDFHVTNSATGTGACKQNSDCSSSSCSSGACAAAQFPSQSNLTTYCNTTPMTPQEKILEYMIWDLSSCVPGSPTSTCTPKTCADFPSTTCGQQGDGCGGLTGDCHPCPAGQICGGGGVQNVCGAPDSGTCTPKTCSDYAGLCGQQSDGCGSVTATCTCPSGQTCGGGGTAGVCGAPPACTKLTCAAYPSTCGVQSDGCGGLTPDCNPCPAGQTCGGCGVPGQCCTPPSGRCTPQACPSGVECGPASDGCGGVIASCGTCTPPQTCGGGGVPGKCGGMNGCVPLTCAQQGYNCGPAGDGCGNLISSCGTCTPPWTCGGGGQPGVCGGGVCTPWTCQQLNIACGPAGDGCGNMIPSCGTCPPGQICGGGGVPGQCWSPTAM
jgi:hypothetical protein